MVDALAVLPVLSKSRRSVRTSVGRPIFCDFHVKMDGGVFAFFPLAFAPLPVEPRARGTWSSRTAEVAPAPLAALRLRKVGEPVPAELPVAGGLSPAGIVGKESKPVPKNNQRQVEKQCRWREFEFWRTAADGAGRLSRFCAHEMALATAIGGPTMRDIAIGRWRLRV